MSIFNKVVQAGEAYLDGVIAKARTEHTEGAERKSFIELGYPDEQQYGYKERTGLMGPGVLKNMARKDSIVIAIINTRIAQLAPFSKQQKDKYSPGWVVVAKKPADLSDDDKASLADPALDEEAYNQLKFELDEKRQKLKAAQDKDIEKIADFVLHCGMPGDETDTTHKRWDFDKFIKAIVWDRLVYNYSAIELIPTKDGESLHHFYPVSSGTIKYVSEQSSNVYQKMIKDLAAEPSHTEKRFDTKKPYRYVQVVRGKIVAAFTEDELIFEPATPTIDPEDNGYAPGELELLVQIVTAHLFAEAHNRNFFTQGIGTKGILHIKGDNINRAQLEAFKRQWFNQVVNSRNAFRPPIIGMADDVKWVSLAQSNREMEFEQWMNYLIRIACAIYQIDPAEINFDISKTNTSTLQEANNEEKLKSSRDKGLRPLLDYVENLVNNHILRYWNPKLADKYEFKFVGFQAESRSQEIDRLEKETKVWKTLNEARIEMGHPPIEDGDIVLNATFTQFKQMKLTAEQQADQGAMGGEPGMEGGGEEGGGADLGSLNDDIDRILSEADREVGASSKAEEKEAKEAEKEKAVEKSQPAVIEYYFDDKENKDE